jgi:hypothetical protein
MATDGRYAGNVAGQHRRRDEPDRGDRSDTAVFCQCAGVCGVVADRRMIASSDRKIGYSMS